MNNTDRNNTKATFDLLLRLSFHSILIFLSFYFFSIGYYITSVLFAFPHWMTFLFMGSTGLSHELFHGSVFTNKKTNNILYKFFMTLTWNNYGYFAATHWLHHKITLDEKDPKSLFHDRIKIFSLIQMFTFDFGDFYKKIKYTCQNAVGHIPKSKSYYLFSIENEKGAINTKKVTYAARVILAFHIITASLFIYFNIWWLIFLINLAPFILGFFNKFLGYAQHYGLSAQSHDDYFKNSRTIILSKFWSFFYSNMNYHIEHHMHPHVPYYNLENIHSKLKEGKNYENVSNGWRGLLIDLYKKGIFDFKL